jgi:hypothetical protein
MARNAVEVGLCLALGPRRVVGILNDPVPSSGVTHLLTAPLIEARRLVDLITPDSRYITLLFISRYPGKAALLVEGSLGWLGPALLTRGWLRSVLRPADIP